MFNEATFREIREEEKYLSGEEKKRSISDGRSISRNVASLNILVHDVINLLYYDKLLLADVFENFRDMCIKEYELDPAHFLSSVFKEN